MNLPPVIKVGATEYILHVGHIKDSDEYGNCDTHLQVITISDNQTRQSAGDTLLHEILHAIWNESGLAFVKRDEETVVRITASWLNMVFKDNPIVAKFIMDPADWPYTATGENRKSK
jgi:hypothetical protein